MLPPERERRMTARRGTLRASDAPRPREAPPPHRSAGDRLGARRGWPPEGLLGRPGGAAARAGDLPARGGLHWLRGGHRAPRPRRGGEPLVAEALALALREAHPEAEPFELDSEVVSRWVAEAGADPDDDHLVAAALVAWEGLLG